LLLTNVFKIVLYSDYKDDWSCTNTVKLFCSCEGGVCSTYSMAANSLFYV